MDIFLGQKKRNGCTERVLWFFITRFERLQQTGIIERKKKREEKNVSFKCA